jgi:hypothetical protein
MYMRAEFSTHTFTFDIRTDHYMDSDIYLIFWSLFVDL